MRAAAPPPPPPPRTAAAHRRPRRRRPSTGAAPAPVAGTASGGGRRHRARGAADPRAAARDRERGPGVGAEADPPRESYARDGSARRRGRRRRLPARRRAVEGTGRGRAEPGDRAAGVERRAVHARGAGGRRRLPSRRRRRVASRAPRHRRGRLSLGHLHAARRRAAGADVWSRPIQALFSIDGQTVGVAIRTIAIVARARTARHRQTRRRTGCQRHRDRTAEGRAGSHRADHLQRSRVRRPVAVDLRDDARHRYPHDGDRDGCREPAPGVRPRADRRCRVAPRRRRARRVPHGCRAERQREDARRVLHAARGGRGEIDRPPRVLLLSQEPYVPWELAAVEPALDPHAPAGAPVFLAAQADVGRWVFGQRRPALPPPVEVDAQSSPS